jgi:ATP-dependent protease HslVU (ClpYQ) peptidase subunit
MSTIIVAQKNGLACIGADTLSSLGSLRQKAQHVVNKTKVAKIGETYIGLTGTSASLVVLQSYFSNPEHPRDFSSTSAIFETLRRAHHSLKAEYFMAAHGDPQAEYETTQFYGLAANPQGIFALYSYRAAQQFHRYWAAGSGRDFALGSMHEAYDRYDKVEDIVKAGLAAAAEFDSGTGAPFELFTVPLATPQPRAKSASKSTSKTKGTAKKAVSSKRKA